MAWSNWQRFLGTNPADKCNGGGVYKIRATSDDGQPKEIPRACADDPEGILYIGQGALRTRIGHLAWLSEDPPKAYHGFVGTFLNYKLDRICSHACLEVSWLECDDPVAVESRLLEEYKMRTGDLPPGNLKVEGRPGELHADPTEPLVDQ